MLFVLDTNVLLSNPRSIFSFGSDDVLLPICVIEELDTFKSGSNELAKNARQVSRALDEMRSRGSLSDGVPIFPDNPGNLRVILESNIKLLPPSLSTPKPDNLILSACLLLQQEFSQDQVTLITKDANLRIKADSLDILSSPPDEDGKVSIEELYTGIAELEVETEQFKEFEATKKLDLSDYELYMNQFVVLRDVNDPLRMTYGRIKDDGVLFALKEHKAIWGIEPKNLEQRFALDLLLDDDIKLVSLVGIAGSGKTILALAAGLHGATDTNKYEKLLVSRPIMPMGKDIGYLPGSVEEKLSVWMTPVFDNLEVLLNDGKKKKSSKSAEILIEQGILAVEPLTFIRGRSIPNQYFIIDECFPYNQKILTDAGKIQIGALHELYARGKKLPKALAFNEKTKTFEYKQILNATHKGIKTLCEIVLGNRKIKCTPDHPLLTVDGWKKTGELKTGDYVISYGHAFQSSLWLNDDQMQVVMGSYLGDGSLSKISKKQDETLYRLKIQHGIKQKEYLEEKMKILRPNDYKIDYIEKNGYSQLPAVKASTVCFGLPQQLQSPSTTINKTDLPFEFLKNLNEKGLAIWFMDDGSKFTENNGARFHTESMSTKSCEVLVELLKNNFKLDATIHIVNKKDKSYNYLQLNKDNYLKLCKIIAPYVFPCMSYKIVNYEELLGGSKIGDYDNKINDFSIVPFKSCKMLVEPKHVFDIEVEELHNFIACGVSGLKDVNTGIVAHNCQNLSAHEIKSIITRAGEGTKIVLTGDPHQIDNPSLDATSNGLSYVVEKMKEFKISGHVTLCKGERSELATLAAEVL